MTDPERLLEGQLPETARRALRAGADLEPPPGAAEQLWATLLPAARPGGGSPSRPPGAGLSASAGPVLKLLLVCGVVCGAAVGLVLLRRHSRVDARRVAGRPVPASATAAQSARPPRNPAVRESPPAPTTSAPARTHVARRAPAPSSRSSAPSRDAPAERKPADTSAGEIALVAEARRALRAGDPGRALSLLDLCDTRFPHGVLGQERDALRIEALARSGQREAAAARARSFVQRYPDSALDDRFRSLLAPPE